MQGYSDYNGLAVNLWKRLSKACDGNWELVPIYTYESPELFTPQSGVDSNLNGDAAPDRTIINKARVAGTAGTVVGLSSSGAVLPNGNPNIVAYMAKNPNARYIQVASASMLTAAGIRSPAAQSTRLIFH